MQAISAAEAGGPKAKAKPEPKPKADKPAPAIKEKKAPPKKPQPMQKEDDAVSLSKKKPPKAKTTREEVDRLEDRIRNIRKKTDYIDVAKAGSGGRVQARAAADCREAAAGRELLLILQCKNIFSISGKR